MDDRIDRSPDREPSRLRAGPFPHAAARHRRSSRASTRCRSDKDWYDWAGYRRRIRCGTRSSNISPSAARRRVFDISPMVKYRIEGPDAEAFCNRLTLRDVAQAQARPRPLHRLVRRRRPCARRRHAVPPRRRRASACAARSGICPGCSTAPIGFDVAIEEETEAVAGLALQGPTSFAVLRDAGLRRRREAEAVRHRRFPARRRQRDRSRAPASPAISATSCSCRRDAGAVAVGPAVRGRRDCTACAPSAMRRSTAPASRPASSSPMPISSPPSMRCAPTACACPTRSGSAGWSISTRATSTAAAPSCARGETGTLRHVLVGLEIEGNVPAEHAIVYHRKTKEVGHRHRRHLVAAGQAQHRHRQPRPALRRHGRRRSLGRDLRPARTALPEADEAREDRAAAVRQARPPHRQPAGGFLT